MTMYLFVIGLCSNLLSSIEMIENKKGEGRAKEPHLRILWSSGRGWRAMDFGIQSNLWQIVGRLALAVLVGSVLGVNRNLQRKPAGIRTHALVSLGTALVTLIAFEGTGHDPGATSRVVQGLVTGIGFVGAGVIIHHNAEHRVEGLTTAATVWITAIFGVACGMGQAGTVLVGLVFALVVLSCGLPVERAVARWLNRGDNFESDQGDTHHTR